MWRNIYLHVRRFLYFTDNGNQADRTEENYDRLCKLQVVFETLNITFSKFYNPSQSPEIDEVFVLLKGIGNIFQRNKWVLELKFTKFVNHLVTYIT